MVTRCTISSAALADIRRWAAAAEPLEACGLLLGKGETITRATLARNVAAAPRDHFEIDPAALFVALRGERAGGPRLLGYWHSHPGGVPLPSRTDGEMAAADGRLWLIVAADQLTVWRAGGEGLHGRFAPVGLDLDAAGTNGPPASFGSNIS